MLVLTRKRQQRIFIGPDIVITVVDIERGRGQVRLGITAPPDVPVHRDEVWARMTAPAPVPALPDPDTLCPGHGRHATGPTCCEQAGEYNGFGSGPTAFTCPKGCSCHD